MLKAVLNDAMCSMLASISQYHIHVETHTEQSVCVCCLLLIHFTAQINYTDRKVLIILKE